MESFIFEPKCNTFKNSIMLWKCLCWRSKLNNEHSSPCLLTTIVWLLTARHQVDRNTSCVTSFLDIVHEKMIFFRQSGNSVSLISVSQPFELQVPIEDKCTLAIPKFILPNFGNFYKYIIWHHILKLQK